jgi:predicted PurR-regulated permease PerM
MTTSSQSPSPQPATPEFGKFHPQRGLFLVIVGVTVFWVLRSFMQPVLVGAIFACVLYPLMRKTERWKISASLRAALITLAFMVAFLIPFAALVVIGADAALSRIQNFPGIGSGPGEFHLTASGIADLLGLHDWLDRLAAFSPLTDEQVRTLFGRAVQTIGGVVVHVLQETLASVPGAIASTFVVLIAIFFFLIDGPRIVRFLRVNSFFNREQTDQVLESTNALCRSVLLATIVTGFVQAVLLTVACLVTGVGSPPVIALVTFVASFLPVVGTAPVTLGLTAYSFIVGNVFAGIVFLVFVALVGIADNIVRPYVMKGGGEIHPLVAFVAAFGALESLGFYGLFIGPVLAGFFFTILPIVTASYSARGK